MQEHSNSSKTTESREAMDLEPERVDIVLDQLRMVIEALEARQRAEDAKVAAIPADVPRFEVR